MRDTTLTSTRRRFLQVGALGGLGLSLPGLLRAADSPGTRKPRAWAVIFLNQFGGPRHHASVDRKPNAPDAIRGVFQPIATTPRVQVCERLPASLRSCTGHPQCSLRHEMKNHNPRAIIA